MEDSVQNLVLQFHEKAAHGCFKTIKKFQLNSRIKPRMYVWRNTIMKNCILLAGTGVKNDSTVVCGFSPIKSIILITGNK